MGLALVALVVAGCAGKSDVKEIALVRNGAAGCRVELRSDAGKAERFAAKELATYLDKVTGCGKIEVKVKGEGEGRGMCPISLAVDATRKDLQEDGFAIEVTADGATVTGSTDFGVIYGVYEILRKYAGLRWVTPGEDGEYFTAKREIVLPVGKDVQNPHLRVRYTIGNDSPEGILWHLRNNMDAPLVKFLNKDAKVGGPGGHIMSDILIGDWTKTRKETLEKLYAEHPEYFPLVGGKRVKINAANDPNPCVSNPAVLDRMAANFLKRLGDQQEEHGYLTIGNNDTTVWCECEKCKALDAPEAKNTRGERSDRYWYMVNEIAKRVWAKRPDAKLGGWAYQNFWYAPVHVRPDKRLRILISFNNQCWRHTCCDPKCGVNKEMVKIYESWKKIGMPLVVNRDEIGTWDGQGGPGCELIPAESVLRTNICRDYPKIGCNGSSFCVPGPFPRFSGFAKKWSPYYGKRYHWYAMWQTCYMSSKFMWNPGTDYDSTLEEANRLFYGAGWEAGMKDFRALLADCFFNAPGCIGWGQGTTTGRCLDKPGSEEKLVAYLEKALAAAKASGDARAIEHVAREKEIFELTWLVQRKRWIESYREMTAYKRTGEITVDGVLDETDWRNADSYSNFAAPSWCKVKNFQKTYLKVVYDRDTLYFGVEAMEPTPEKIIAGDKVDRFAQACANLGNHLELFYSYPDMNQAAWHLMINSKGQIIDALQKSATVRDLSLVTRAKWAVKTQPDRWTLEIAIPCSEIGQNILDGMTWRINCARQREVEGSPRETTSAANGSFHGTANFVNVKFLAKRTGTGAHDAASWKNGGFNETEEIAKLRHPEFYKSWKSEVKPKVWSADGDGSCLRKEGADGDWYVQLRKGQLCQYFLPQAAGKVKIRFRARGTGKVGLILLNYVNHTEPGAKGYKALEAPKVQQPWFDLTNEWKDYEFTREVTGAATERVSIRFVLANGSTADIDDCLVYPVE